MENDRDTSLQSWEFLTLFLPRFQSVLNSEVWWASPSRGVASRPMSRTSRSQGVDTRQRHGYKGRLYTFVTGAALTAGEAAVLP